VTAEEVLAAALVPPTRRVFFLGNMEKRVTLHAQQLRALNLADALLECDTIRTNGAIAIIGGGVGGVTLAAALGLVAPELKIVLYEEQQELLYLQVGATSRYIHPNLFDWPAVGSTDSRAGLPVLDWEDGIGDEVAKGLLRDFDTIRKGSGIELRRAKVAGIEPVGSWAAARIRDDQGIASTELFEAVIIAVGFGLEREVSVGSNPSYWRPSPVAGPFVAAQPQTVLISGNGDGGLADFMLAAFSQQQRDILRYVTDYPHLEPVKAELDAIDNEAWADPGFDIFAAYRARLTPILPPHLLMDIRDRLRDPCRLVFHTREARLFRRDTAILNRFVCYLAIEADIHFARNSIELLTGCSIESSTDAAVLTFSCGASVTPTVRLLRFGPDTEAVLVPFADLAVEYKNAHPVIAGARPVMPVLTATAAHRWAGFAPTVPAPLPAGANPDEPVRVSLDIDAGGQAVLTGTGFDAVAAFWDPHSPGVRLTVSAGPEAVGPLVAALARLCAHAPNAVLISGRYRGWDAAWSGLRVAMPGPAIDIALVTRAPAVPPLVAVGVTSPPIGVAEAATLIQKVLDADLLARLNAALYQALEPAVPVSLGWVIEPALRHKMWLRWQQWLQVLGADSTICRRFLLLLATENDDAAHGDDALIRLGPLMLKAHLTRAAVLALAVALCSQHVFEPAGDRPGNLRTGSVSGHACGVAWIDGTDIGPEVAARVWTTGIVLLSELDHTVEQLRLTSDVRLDEEEDSPADVTQVPRAERPVVMGCDVRMRQALAIGELAVVDYVQRVFGARASADAAMIEPGA
jgi:hypothetical protein